MNPAQVQAAIETQALIGANGKPHSVEAQLWHERPPFVSPSPELPAPRRNGRSLSRSGTPKPKNPV